jgi:hypothetical protein
VHRERDRQLPNVVAVARQRQLAPCGKRLADRLGAGRGIAVEVATDPAPERERRRRARHTLAVLGEQQLGRVDQAVLEEPEPVAQLVGRAGPAVPNLVGLPEDRDLLAELVLHAGALRLGLGRVERGQQSSDAHVGEQDRPARRLRRMGGEHELQRDPGGAFSQLARSDVCEALERLRERLPRRRRLGRVLPAAAQAVVLLRDVRQLEVQRERAQDLRLVAGRQRPHGFADGRDVTRRARVAGEQPDPLLGLEELPALLLEEDRAERLSEQPDVAPERCVWTWRV